MVVTKKFQNIQPPPYTFGKNMPCFKKFRSCRTLAVYSAFSGCLFFHGFSIAEESLSGAIAKSLQRFVQHINKPSAETELLRLQSLAKTRYELEKYRLVQECKKLEDFALTVAVNSDESVLKQLGRPSDRQISENFQVLLYWCHDVNVARLDIQMVRNRQNKSDEELTEPDKILGGGHKRLVVSATNRRISSTDFGYPTKARDADINVNIVK